MNLPPVAKTIAEVRHAVAHARSRGQRIGCVPTMGALHEGHASLIRAAKERSDYVVVTLFVNPTQFGPNEDFARYPRTLEADQMLCAEVKGDVIFAPSVDEMYPAGATTFVEVAGLGDYLCGPRRPGHFRGVCTVVAKLFHIVQPDRASFGAKDGQQARILRKMAQDLNMPVIIDIEPTVREADGLALSSRNRYLSESERALAPRIYQALQEIRQMVNTGERDVAHLEQILTRRLIEIPGARLDYAEIVDEVTLHPVARIEKPVLCAVSVFLGTTRLIDNIVLP